jgi:hypothetical protein
LTYKLDYQSEPEINRVFQRIGTSEGLKQWTDPKAESNYTIVAYIREPDLRSFQDATRIITKTGHQFKPSKNLHCTLISLKENSNEDEIQSIFRHTERFFERKKLGQIRVYFDIIHPGKDKKHADSSDNAVISLSREYRLEGQSFLKVIHELENYLDFQGYSNIIERHKVPNTIWCTLGFFIEPHFKVDLATYSAFNAPELGSFSASATFNEIAITRYRLKSLDDGQILYKVKL